MNRSLSGSSFSIFTRARSIIFSMFSYIASALLCISSNGKPVSCCMFAIGMVFAMPRLFVDTPGSKAIFSGKERVRGMDSLLVELEGGEGLRACKE
jgi:hypothetical protein